MARHFRIHPAIGAARMGNSPGHFIGPETAGVPGNWNDAAGIFNSFKDLDGKILRQGARFRVFEYDADQEGALINPREVIPGVGIRDIEWRVHIANRKASFFAFDGQNGARDIYVARSAASGDEPLDKDPPCNNLRNSSVGQPKRSATLDIDPGEKVVSQSQPGPVELTNPNKAIPINSLGTLLLDGSGRLVVLGGYGQSNSSGNPQRPIIDYANNDTWFDDAGDGSIKARVFLSDGTAVDADPAWVFVGPPKFTPALDNVVRLFDTLCDVAVRELDFPVTTPKTGLLDRLRQMSLAWKGNGGKSLAGFTPSFTSDVYPLLKRALGVRDVHVSGTGGDINYHKVTLGQWEKLSVLQGPDAPRGQEMRKTIFEWMRDPDSSEVNWKLMPRGLGDDYTSLDKGSPIPSSFLSLTRIQYAILREWAAGNFLSDWPGNDPKAAPLDIPTPDDLDQAATEHSVGGPFFPGIEVSWLIRTPTLFSEPFRLRISSGPESGAAPLKVGALIFGPGFFSQQMALPWQADFYDCHTESHVDPDHNEYSFMWWTAQRPDKVFPSKGLEQKRWVREFDAAALDPDDPENFDDHTRFSQMQQRWFELKFISVFNGDHWEETP